MSVQIATEAGGVRRGTCHVCKRPMVVVTAEGGMQGHARGVLLEDGSIIWPRSIDNGPCPGSGRPPAAICDVEGCASPEGTPCPYCGWDACPEHRDGEGCTRCRRECDRCHEEMPRGSEWDICGDCAGECGRCGGSGSGLDPETDCPTCGGTGKREEAR